MLPRRGQAAVEMIILLAISLLVLSSVLTFSIDATERSDEKVRLAQARATVQDLTEAADMLYAEGEGARTEIFLQMPDAFSPEGSYLLNKTANIALYVAGKQYDVPGSAKTNLCGDLPSVSGGHWVTLEVRSGCVHVGSKVLIVSPGSLSFSVAPEGTDRQSISVTNGGNQSIDVNVTWNQGTIPATISVAVLPTLLGLGPDNSSSINATVTVPIDAAYGTYTGWITLDAIEGGDVVDSERVSVEITVSLSHMDIMLYPVSWNAGSFLPGDDASNVFTICNNGGEHQIVNLSVTGSASISLEALTTSIEQSKLNMLNVSVVAAIQYDATDSTTDVNISDNNRATVNQISSGTPQWIDINYTASIPSNTTVAYARLDVEHYESAALVAPQMQWWDGAGWQAICTLPDRVGSGEETLDTCDLSGHIDTVSEASNVSLRIYYTYSAQGNREGYLDYVGVAVGYGTTTEVRGAFIRSVLTGVDAGGCNTTTVYIYTFEADEDGSHSARLNASASIGSDASSISFTVAGPADVTVPNVSATAVNVTSEYANGSVCVNATVIEANFDSAWTTVVAPDGTETNYPMTDTACGMPADDNIYGVAVSLTQLGNWTVNTTFANDTSGNLGNQTPHPNLQVEVLEVLPTTETLTVTDTTGKDCASGCTPGDLNDADAAYESELDKNDELPMAISDLSGSGAITDVKVTIHYGNADSGIPADAMEVYISTSATEDAGTIYCKATYTPPVGSTTTLTFDCEDNPVSGGLDTSAEVNAMYVHIDNEVATAPKSFYVDYVSTSVTYAS